MADRTLFNDDVMTIPIRAKDAAGDFVALPTGVTPTIVNSDGASMSATVSGSSYTLRALVPTAASVTIEVHVGTLTPEITTWEIAADVTPVSVSSDFADATHTPQTAPVAAPTPAP